MNIFVLFCFRFRRGFKQFFQCCPFIHMSNEMLTRSTVVTSRYHSCSGSPDHRIKRNGKRAGRNNVHKVVFEAQLQFLQIPNDHSSIHAKDHQKEQESHQVSSLNNITHNATDFRLSSEQINNHIENRFEFTQNFTQLNFIE